MRRPAGDPELIFTEGTPVSGRFGDVYFSRENGLAETAHVFHAGCELPSAWADHNSFAIGETGFGTGLNFLATWELWRHTRPADGILHYVSVEGFPIGRGALAQALKPFRHLAPLARQLVDGYPSPGPGHHRIWFPRDRICLTLVIGEAEEALRGISGRMDAWFLDGFAPAKNPEMWSEGVIAQIARLSRPGARLASFTAAGDVRRKLQAVGFEIRKRPGFGSKWSCIAGTFAGPDSDRTPPWFRPPPRVANGPILVVGAGIAGASMVRALRRRGREVRWVDRRDGLAAEASGNPVGILMPRPTVAPSPPDTLSAAAFRHALAEIGRLGVPYNPCGAIELAVDGIAAKRLLRLAEAGALDAVGGRLVDAAEASRLAGVALDRPAIAYARGGWISPVDWVAGLAGRHRPERSDGIGDAIPPEVVGTVLALGSGAVGHPLLEGLPMVSVRGQLTAQPATRASLRLRSVITYGGYLAPAQGGVHALGATYDRGGFDPTLWPQPALSDDDIRNFNGLPDHLQRLIQDSPAPGPGRASLRASTPDQLPAVGPVPLADGYRSAYAHLGTDASVHAGGLAPLKPGLFVLSGLGSRGLVTAPLMAELLASLMFDEPLPVDRTLAEALHPARFLIRDLKRGTAGHG
ncbi:MAG: tRNA (5-methylaminomethyl-2-thiouridine)(34)-methyltransferase MnmD [Alphaproteobacteria bacterium]|nr:tRNA (5-methylaminomethyl-2-thiouridine)(34)-methyltransferase MnmD [Alphaproteobacteria bacterium]